MKRIFLLFSFLLANIFSYSAVWYVNQSATGSNNGSSWENAFTNVQDGIDAAYLSGGTDSEVWVAKGKYLPTSYNPLGTNGAVLNRTKTFVMKDQVDVYGGFSGNETSIDQRANYWIGQANETILSGDLDNNDDYSQWETYNSSTVNNDLNSYNVVYYYNVSSETILDGFTISGGNANKKVSSRPYHDGGGAHLTNKNAYLQNCRIIYNRGNNAGGVITFSGGTLIDCVISHNLATGECGDAGDAGGVKLHDAGHLINSIVTDNYSSNSTARGGGVCCSWSISTVRHYIINCVITNNHTNGTGGGIGNYGTSSSHTYAYNTILWNNYQDAAKNQVDGTPMAVNYCGVEGGYSGTGNYNLNATNTNASGPNFFDPVGGDWRLEATSPCINIGYNNAVNGSLPYLGTIEFDLAGNARILETTVDMGVYENVYIAPVVTIQPDGYGRVFVKSGSSGAANGNTWADATSWLQGAMDAAEDFETNNPGTNAQVWLAEGTYYPTASITGLEADTKGKAFLLRNGVEMYGGFPDDADDANNSTLNSRDMGSNTVYLSGDIGQPGDQSDNSYHVLWAGTSALSAETVLDGFTITEGNASGTTPHNMGGGLYNTSSSPKINNCHFTSNIASANGGGIYVASNASPILTNCIFYSNTANDGGAIYHLSSSSEPKLINCTLAGNTALSNGGGVYNEDCPSVFKNCIVWGNEATTSGDEFYISTQAVIINNSCYANETGDVSGTLTANICITSDPFYVDEANKDYRLYDNSACVNTGNNSFNTESFDIRSENRIQNTTIDMGAFEWTSGVDPSHTLNWTGNVGTAWDNQGNWDENLVPSLLYDVIIPNVVNDPIITLSANASCNNLTIETGGFLLINSGGSLITNGTITNNGIINTQRTITDGTWHLVSSPITSATANTFLDDYLQTWDETSATWRDIVNPATALTPAKGYSLWGVAKGDYTFSGTPSTGNQSIAITYTEVAGKGNDGANLLGNPYPSSIDWSGLDDTYGAVYYWNGTQYANWINDVGTNGGVQYVPPMQGFFIVTGSAGTFSLTNDNRTHSGATSFYKSTEKNALSNGLVLTASNGSYSDELYVLLDNAASPDFELQRDAYKFMSGTPGLAEIYSFSGEKRLSIDVRPECNIIPLGFANDEAGIYSIAIKEISDISTAILEDTKTNTFHDLTKGAYEFAWDLGDDEMRFKLHFKAVGIEESAISESDIRIYAADQQIFIKTGAEADGRLSLITVTDVMGRIVLQQNLSANETTAIPVNLETGVYIVSIKSGREIKTEKVFIK